MSDARSALRDRVAALIDRLSGGGRDEAVLDALLVELLRYQVARIAPWRRLVEARAADPNATADPLAVPAVPTDVFRYARAAVHSESEDVRVFRTSGTTTGRRGAHSLRDLSLYDRAARAAARQALFPDFERMRLIVLAPDEHEAPDSSLSYMLARFGEWFGSGESDYVWRGGRLELPAFERALGAAIDTGAPVALLGTSFAFVHAEDALSERRTAFVLPTGSRIMHTGGFKGRSREVDPGELRRRLAARYHVGDAHIVVEYGMTELSSQMYEAVLDDALAGRPAAPGWLWVPGWMRATPVDADTLSPVPDGEVGILRIDDAANLDTPCCIQTADLARRVGGRIELLGRSPDAVPRGCSLAVDEALGAHA